MILAKENGTFKTVASGSGLFKCNKAYYDAHKNDIPNNTAILITDDAAGGEYVTEDEAQALINATLNSRLSVVGDFIHCALPAFTLSGASQVVMSNVNVPAGTWLLVGSFMNCYASNEIKIVANGTGATVNSGIIRAFNGEGDDSHEVTAVAKFVSDTNTVGISFSGSDSLEGGGNGDSRYWYVNAIRIG
mgnify:CR=1 FL=1